MKPANIELQKERKSEGSSKLKAQQVVALQSPAGALNERRRLACQILFFFFFFCHFQSCYVLFCFQNKVAHGERSIFAYEYMVGRDVCKGDEATLMILMSV